MGKQKLTGGDALVGSLLAKQGVSAGSRGFAISVASVSYKVARVPLSAGTTGERTYGFAFAVGDVIQNVYLDISTREQTASDKTIDVGLLSSEPLGDNDGFLDGASTASVGVVQGSLVAGSVTRGALLSEGTAASGRFVKQHVILGTAALTLASKLAEAQTELVGDIVVQYISIA